MTPGGRRAVALLVPVALAIAAWLALRDSTSEPRAGDGGDVVPRPAAGAPSVPAPAIPSPSRALAPRGPGAERRRTPPADASRGGTEVVVTTTSGVPATPATVQVLPPAAADPDGVAEYAWAETDESGRATVREPRPGSYDLFVDWGPVRRRFRGVTLPGAERVRLTVPDRMPVRVTLDDEARARIQAFQRAENARQRKRGAPVVMETFVSATFAESPVPGSTPRTHALYVPLYGAPELFASTNLPIDRTYAVAASAGPAALLHSDPSSVTAPQATVLRSRPAFPLTLVASAMPLAEHAAVLVDLDWQGALEEGLSRVECRGSGQPHRTLVWVRTSSGELRWSGNGVVPGSKRWEGLSEEDVGVLVMEVVVDPSTLPAVTRGDGHEVEVTFSEDLDRAEGALVVDDRGERLPVDADGLTSATGSLREGPRWIAATSGEYGVAGPVRASAVGRDSLHLRRGGYVVLVPETTYPEGAGRLTLARPGGVPLTYGDRLQERHLVEPGEVLGPFPAGRIELEVSLGGVVVDRIPCEVRPGRYVPLVIPDVSAPSR